MVLRKLWVNEEERKKLLVSMVPLDEKEVREYGRRNSAVHHERKMSVLSSGATPDEPAGEE